MPISKGQLISENFLLFEQNKGKIGKSIKIQDKI
jgi:hypothetical protein